MKNPFVSLVTKTLTSAATSIVSGEIKKRAKGCIEQLTAKSPEQARAEATARLGYETDSFSLDKKQNVVFKSNPIFVNEWLNNSPITAGKILRDEETGEFFYNDKFLDDSLKNELAKQFVKATQVSSAAVSSHLEAALKKYPLIDFTAIKFRKEFAGWEPGRTSVIDSWLTNCFGIDDPYSSKLFRKWIIGTTKRIISPGSLLDGCLTLTGPGMLGKTSFFRNLLPSPFDQRTNEINCNPKNPQKFVENVIGKSICCFDELQVLDFVKSVETFKQILTTQYIDVRLAYRRNPTRFALRSGFCATTNKKTFIKDPFLSRRLWVINLNESNRLDFNYMLPNRKFLWQEALYCVENNENYYLSPDEQKEIEKVNSIYLSK